MTKTNLLLVMLLSLLLGAGAVGVGIWVSRALAKPEQGRQKPVGDEVGMTEAPLMAAVDKSELKKKLSEKPREKQARTEAVTRFLKTLQDGVDEFGIEPKSIPGLDNATVTTVQPSQLVDSLKRAIENKLNPPVSGKASDESFIVKPEELVTRTRPRAKESFFIDDPQNDDLQKDKKIWFAWVSTGLGEEGFWTTIEEMDKEPPKTLLVKSDGVDLTLKLDCVNPTVDQWLAAYNLNNKHHEIKNLDDQHGEWVLDGPEKKVIGRVTEAEGLPFIETNWTNWIVALNEHERKTKILEKAKSLRSLKIEESVNKYSGSNWNYAGFEIDLLKVVNNPKTLKELNLWLDCNNKKFSGYFTKKNAVGGTWQKSIIANKEDLVKALAEINAGPVKEFNEIPWYRWVVVPALKEASPSP